MPIFGLKNAKRKIPGASLSSLVLRKTQSTGNIEDPNDRMILNTRSNIIIRPIIASSDTISILRSPNQKHTTHEPPSPPLHPVMEENLDDHSVLATKLRDITACDMDLLLSLETQARMDCQEEKEKKQQQQQIRPSKIKFDLPITPPRSKSPDLDQRQRRWSMPEESNNNNNVKKKVVNSQGRITRWSRLIKQQKEEEALHNHTRHDTSSPLSSSEEDSISDNTTDISQQRITIGSKVKLFKRPLPIIGTVKYLGKVHFDTGEWLGIELDSRVGNTDGKVDGQRYFTTYLHCGIFVKKEDAIKV